MRALLQRVSRAEVRVDGEVVGGSGRGWSSWSGSARRTTPRPSPTRSPGASPSCGSSRDDDGPDEPLAARRRWGGARRVASSRCTPTPAAVAGRASPGRRRRSWRSRSTSGSRPRSRAWASRSRRVGSARRWPSSWSTTGRSRSGSTRRPTARPGHASPARWPAVLGAAGRWRRYLVALSGPPAAGADELPSSARAVRRRDRRAAGGSAGSDGGLGRGSCPTTAG